MADEIPDDAMRPDDRALAEAIVRADDDRFRVALIRVYWRDQDRSDRSPRALLSLHLGLLVGMCDRLLYPPPKPPLVGWSDIREKAE